jgi:Na+/melibiose symporter-like transporter
MNATLLFFILPESLKPESRTAKSMRGIGEVYAALKNKSLAVISANYFLLVTAFSIMTTAFVLFTTHRFGYTALENGYMFSFIGVLAVMMQAGLFVKLERIFGEIPLTIVGCLILAASLFWMPFIRPEYGGLTALLFGSAFITLGNALASPSLTSLASKCAHEGEQGRALGVLQSGASLARAIGPALCGFLLNNASNQLDDTTIQRTFFTASAIMFGAFVVAAYFTRTSPVHETAS